MKALTNIDRKRERERDWKLESENKIEIEEIQSFVSLSFVSYLLCKEQITFFDAVFHSAR